MVLFVQTKTNLGLGYFFGGEGKVLFAKHAFKKHNFQDVFLCSHVDLVVCVCVCFLQKKYILIPNRY